MSLVPNIHEEPRYDDLCWQCGREIEDCICRERLPDDFDPLDEDGYDPDWDDYDDDLTIGEDYGPRTDSQSTSPSG